MRNNFVPPPEVEVEYDTPTGRRRKLFKNPFNARIFYVRKQKEGKNPKLVNPKKDEQ